MLLILIVTNVPFTLECVKQLQHLYQVQHWLRYKRWAKPVPPNTDAISHPPLYSLKCMEIARVFHIHLLAVSQHWCRMELGRAPIEPEASFMCVKCGRRSSDSISVPAVVVRVFFCFLHTSPRFLLCFRSGCLLSCLFFYFVKYALFVCSAVNCLQQGFKAVCAVLAHFCSLSTENHTLQTSYSLALCNGLRRQFYMHILYIQYHSIICEQYWN